MSSCIKVGEPEREHGGPFTLRKVRRYRKRVADIRSWGDRRLSVLNIYLDTSAYRASSACWRVPNDIVYTAKSYGVTHVCLQIEDGTQMLAPVRYFQGWQTPEGVTPERTNGGVTAYHVPEKMFAVLRPPEDVSQDALIARMQIKGTR